MEDWILLSHRIQSDTPEYRGVRRARIESLSSIEAGDGSNSLLLILPNHMGTHLDAPYHFDQDGPSITDYPNAFWFFRAPHIASLKWADCGHLISARDVEKACLSAPLDCDLLLLSTGIEEERDCPAFWNQNPGIAADVADYLRERFPSLRVLGMDLISLTGFIARAEGREAHAAFLSHERPILLLEDVKFSAIQGSLDRVLVSPLFVENADGAPCTVWGRHQSTDKAHSDRNGG